MQIFQAAGAPVKKIGRTHEYNGALWLALSGSGAEFTFYGKKAEVTLKGDSTAQGTGNFARFGIDVNGVRVIDDRMDQIRKTYTVFDSGTDEQVTIRIVKLSEAAMSTVGIETIGVEAEEGIRPTPDKRRKIEFIGDSITCGYGIDDESGVQAFSTDTEDAARAYAYLTAQALDADYSLVAYSGYGIISGYTENDAKLLTHLIPDYYEKWAKSEGRPEGELEPLTIDWDFAQFVPDLIVVNLGTNDDSYTRDVPDRQEEFGRQYVRFLEQVRSRNAQSDILCTLGMMGDRLYPHIEQAVRRYNEQTGDARVFLMKFDVQQAENGSASDGHPSPKTHAHAAETLTRYIERLWR
ncbi:SGNH/GDSL hydrolase family protein [Saccharibacillus qingshengii]|uniref:SGNH/GDSL hydrolase family protein n=1 Tax=Saccharibacillus qingshengii TaxID=1763540 RepID=UPI0015542411|nr:SGNH/GDSL hydrolase family protein [Saccharibacillus qingshengii]